MVEDTARIHDKSPETDAQTVRQVLAAWWSAVNYGDVERLLQVASGQLEIVSPDEEPVAGEAAREALRQFFREFAVDLHPFAGEEIVVSGDLAYQRYTYEWTLTPRTEGAPRTERGHGIHILERQPDGSWKVTKDIYNTVPSG